MRTVLKTWKTLQEMNLGVDGAIICRGNFVTNCLRVGGYLENKKQVRRRCSPFFFAYASSILSLFKLNDVPSRNTTHLQLTWLYLYIGFFPVMVFWIQMYIYKRTPFPHFFWMKYWWYEDSLQDLALLWRGALPLRVVNGGWMGPNDAAVIVMLQEALLGPDMVDDLAALQQMWGKDARELRRWVQQYATGSLWDPLSIQVWLGTWIVLVEYQLRDLPQLYAMRMFKKQIM